MPCDRVVRLPRTNLVFDIYWQATFRLEEGDSGIQDWEVERVVLGHYQDVWGLAAHPFRLSIELMVHPRL